MRRQHRLRSGRWRQSVRSRRLRRSGQWRRWGRWRRRRTRRARDLSTRPGPPAATAALDADVEQRIGTAALEPGVVGVTRTGVVVSAGTAGDGGLHEGVGVLGQLRPQQTAVVVETHEPAAETLRRLCIRRAGDLGRQLVGLLRRPVLGGTGQVLVGVGRGDRGEGGEHVEGQAAVGQRCRQRRQFLHPCGRLDEFARPGPADVAARHQPLDHGEGAVTAPRFGLVELGDLAQHGALVLRDRALVGGDALRQILRAGVGAVVAAERTALAPRRGKMSGRRRESEAGAEAVLPIRL